MQSKYWGFITYSQRDTRFAQWLHRQLERYRVPKTIVGSPGYGGPVPTRVYPIFRDRDELSTSAELSDAIETALKDSSCLIVVCSAHAARSAWVNKEIRSFRRMGRDARVFAIIIDGEPFASERIDSDEHECFPEALRFREVTGSSPERSEPLAADIRDEADGKRNALLKILAAMLGVDYDRLRRRDQQRRHQRLLLSAIAGVVLAIFMGGLAATAWQARNDAEQQRVAAEKNARDAKHQLGKAMVEKARRLYDERRPLPAAMLSARALGMDASAGPFLLPDDPAWQEALSFARTATVIKPQWRSGYRPRLAGQVAFAADNTMIVASLGRTLWFDVRTGEQSSPLVSIPFQVSALVTSADGGHLAVRSQGRVRVWDLPHRRELSIPPLRLRDPPGLDDASLAISSGGRYLAVISEKELLLVDLTDQTISTLPRVAQDVWNLWFSPDSRFLAYRGAVNVGCWSLTEHRWQWVSKSRSPDGVDGLWPVGFAPSGELLAQHEQTLLRVSSTTGEHLDSIPLGTSIFRIAFGPSADRFYVTDGNTISRYSWPAGVLQASRKIAKDTLMSIVPSRDGAHVVAVSEVDTHILRASDLMSVTDDSGFSGPAYGVAWTRDGSQFAAVDRDGFSIWNRRKELLHWIEQRGFHHVEFSPNATLMAGCGDSGVVIWSTADWSVVYNDEDDWDCYDVSFSPDGTLLVGSRMGSLDLIDTVQFQRVREVERDRSIYGSDHIHPVEFLPDGRRVVAGDSAGRVELIDIITGKVKRTMPSAYDTIDALTVLGEGRYIAAAGGLYGQDSTIHIYDVTSGARMFQLSGPAARVHALAAHPTQWILASAHHDGTLVVWDLQTRAVKSMVELDSRAIEDVAFDSTGNTLLTASRAVMWSDASSLFPAYEVRTDGPGAVQPSDPYVALGQLVSRTTIGYGFDFVSEGKHLAVGRADGAIALYSRADSKLLHMFRGHQAAVCAVSADRIGKFMASAGVDGEVRIWSVQDRRLLRAHNAGRGAAITGLAFSEEAGMFAAADALGFVEVRDTETGRLLERRAAGPVSGLRFHGKALIVIGASSIMDGSGLIEIWDIAGGTRKVAPQLHDYAVTALDIHARFVASGDESGRVAIWSLDETTLQAVIDTHAGAVTDILWLSADSLATADRDGFLSVWNVPEKTLRARMYVGRVDRMRRDPLEGFLVTGVLGLIRAWHIPTEMAVDRLLKQGEFDGLDWRMTFGRGLHAQPQISFQ